MKKLIGIIAALAMITGSAYAADWNFYGSARVSTFVTDKDSTDNTSFGQDLQGNARIGATVKASDSLKGGFEYGSSEGNANIRKLYGEWNFGAGSLLVGQTYTPANVFYSNQVYDTDTDLLSTGGIYSGRKAMLRLKFGGFEIAAVDPQAQKEISWNGTKFVDVASVETNMPGIEAAYDAKFNNISLFLTAGYNSYEATVGTTEYDVDTYFAGVGAKADFGPAFIAANVYAGQNVGHMLWVATSFESTTDAANKGQAKIANGELVDNDALGFILVAGYKLNDMFSFEAGYGYIETEYDEAGADEDEAASYYMQSTITLAPGVYVIPEIGVQDGEEAGEEKNTYYGAKWQINF